MITILFQLLRWVLWAYTWVLVLAVLYSILSQVGVLDTRNRLVWSIGDFLYRATEPVLRPIRRVLPNFGGFDFSPLIVLVLLQIVVIPLVDRLYVAIAQGVWSQLLL